MGRVGHGQRWDSTLWQMLTDRAAPNVWISMVLAILCLPLLIWLPIRISAAFVIGSIGLVLMLIHPILALYVVLLSIPIQELIILPGGLSVTQAALLFATFTWGIRVLAYPERTLRFGLVTIPLVMLLWALTLSTFMTTYSQIEGLNETLRWMVVLLIYLMTLNTVAGSAMNLLPWHIIGLMVCLLLAPTITALYGLWQFITAIGPPSFLIAGGRFARAYGTIGQPNSFAAYMNMAWPLAVALSIGSWYALTHQRSTLHRLIVLSVLICSLTCATILLAALGASLSRGGWIGAFAGGCVILGGVVLLWGRSLMHHLWLGGGIALAVIAAVLLLRSSDLLPTVINERLTSIAENMRLFDVRAVQAKPETFAVIERMAHMQSAWVMARDYPLTGVGPGSYTLAYEGDALNTTPYAIHPWYTGHGHAHNYYLHILATVGLIGLAAYFFLTMLLMLQAYRTMQVAHGWVLQSIALGGAAVIVATAIHNLFENVHVLNLGLHLAAIWGILTAIEELALRKQDPFLRITLESGADLCYNGSTWTSQPMRL